jgi:hypothetical protein
MGKKGGGGGMKNAENGWPYCDRKTIQHTWLVTSLMEPPLLTNTAGVSGCDAKYVKEPSEKSLGERNSGVKRWRNMWGRCGCQHRLDQHHY